MTVEVTPEACTAYPSGHVTANVHFVGFGEVTVNIDLLCTCNCSTSVDQVCLYVLLPVIYCCYSSPLSHQSVIIQEFYNVPHVSVMMDCE